MLAQTIAHNCLCGQCAATEVPAKDWIVTTIKDHGAGTYYRYSITGINLNYPTCHPSSKFSWSVRDLKDERYDLALAEMV